jgi:hypothetical protein
MPARLLHFMYIHFICALSSRHFSHQVSAVRAPADSGVDEEIAEIRRRHQSTAHEQASSSSSVTASASSSTTATATATSSSSSECGQTSSADDNVPSVAPLPQGTVDRWLDCLCSRHFFHGSCFVLIPYDFCFILPNLNHCNITPTINKISQSMWTR